MKRCRRLADLLTIPAGELLADGLDDLPLPGDDFQRLGRRRQNGPPDRFVTLLHLAHLHDARRSTAGAGGRCLDHNALAGQMVGERLSGGAAAIKSRDRGLRSSGIGPCPILLEVRLEGRCCATPA